MIGPDQLVNGVWMGVVLIFLGLFPDVLQGIADGVAQAPARFAPLSLPPGRSRIEIRQPRWFAAAGAALIAVSILAYCAG